MARVGENWIGPNDQVYEIVEDTGSSYRADVHHRRGGLTPNTWTFSHHEFNRMIETLPLKRINSVTAAILHEVLADATSQLQRAMGKKHTFKASQALKKVVEAALPDRHMPSSKIDTVYRRTGGPHVAFKWVSAKGMLTLLAEIPRTESWDRITVTAFITYPGITRRPTMLYRNETKNVEALPSLISQAVRQFEGL